MLFLSFNSRGALPPLGVAPDPEKLSPEGLWFDLSFFASYERETDSGDQGGFALREGYYRGVIPLIPDYYLTLHSHRTALSLAFFSDESEEKGSEAEDRHPPRAPTAASHPFFLMMVGRYSPVSCLLMRSHAFNHASEMSFSIHETNLIRIFCAFPALLFLLSSSFDSEDDKLFFLFHSPLSFPVHF